MTLPLFTYSIKDKHGHSGLAFTDRKERDAAYMGNLIESALSFDANKTVIKHLEALREADDMGGFNDLFFSQKGNLLPKGDSHDVDTTHVQIPQTVL